MKYIFLQEGTNGMLFQVVHLMIKKSFQEHITTSSRENLIRL